MRVLAIENYPKTTLGLVGTALREAGAEVDIVRTHAGDPLPPSHDAFDGVVVLGGAQSALDDAEHPYLLEEMRLARAAGDAGKPVLGICLGAQLLARAYGGKNLLGRPLEFGWHDVHATKAGRTDPVLAALDDGAPLFHWHFDTFTLPPGAIHLAESAMTPMQAFRVGAAVYGIQFHFEAGTELVADWNRDFAGEIAPAVPDWFARHPSEAATHGAAADAAGLTLARAWVGLLRRNPSSRRRTPAKKSGNADCLRRDA